MEEDPFSKNHDAAVVLPIEDSLDLHSFTPRDIKFLVEEYLFQCHQRGILEVRLIHGRGKGTQRQMVRSQLARHPLVADFKDAAPEAGGWGTTLVRLQPKTD